MRIQVDPGGLQTPGFAGLNQEVVSAIAAFAGPLRGAGGAVGDAGLAGAIWDLADASPPPTDPPHSASLA